MSALPDLRELAARLHGEVSGNQVLCPGPQHSARDRSLGVKPSPDARDGFIVISYCGDSWQTCRDHVKALLGIETSRRREVIPPARQSNRRRSDAWRQIWDEARDPVGTIVEKYLDSRGLELHPDIAGTVIKYHPTCWFGLEKLPCMVALFRDILSDEPIAVHRTALTTDGRKLDRRMLGSVANAAIKLDADANVTNGLTIGEGLETALSGRQLGFRPTWSVGSAGAIARFPVLHGIEALTILTEDCEANSRAVESCGNRWLAEGAEVILVAPKSGKDLNDALRGAA